MNYRTIDVKNKSSTNAYYWIEWLLGYEKIIRNKQSIIGASEIIQLKQNIKRILFG